MGEIYGRICDLMNDIEAIGKDQQNTHQKYNFRGIDDVYNCLHKSLAKHRIFTIPEVINERHEERTDVAVGALVGVAVVFVEAIFGPQEVVVVRQQAEEVEDEDVGVAGQILV